MLDAGIISAKSQEGKDFCTKQCPYPDCILFDTKKEKTWFKNRSRKTNIIQLSKKGKTLQEIADTLRISVGTVQRYLHQ